MSRVPRASQRNSGFARPYALLLLDDLVGWYGATRGCVVHSRLTTLRRITMADARPVPPPGGPLSGIRVLDFTRYQQGPMATVFLSDLGCEVVKVEEPGGEPGRANGLQPDGFSAYFEAHNRGKQSGTFDHRTEAARGAVKSLVPGFGG